RVLRASVVKIYNLENIRRGDDGDDDNGERLLTKIEVVVMTGIARDEALRGDA
ncbi:hypothetical protein ALC60_03040, partial [Trachymyrmex zeteki]